MSESSSAPRIAIRFGTASAPAKPTNGRKVGQPRPPSTLGKRQRPNALNDGSDSDDDDINSIAGKYQTVTTIGDDSPRTEFKNPSRNSRSEAPFIISGHKNRDWKAEVKAQKGNHHSATKDTQPADQDKEIKWGLNVTKKPSATAGAVTQHLDSPHENPHDQVSSPKSQDVGKDQPVSDDADAIDALLGRRKPGNELIIKEASKGKKTISEGDAYHKMMQEAADVPTLDEYDEIPEGGFGAAMLRGMGWTGDEGESKPRVVKRRPNLAGLGATEDEEIRKAELAKKHGHRDRRPRLDEYRRDREKERQDREDRRKESYKSERDRERRYRHDHRHSDRDHDRDSHTSRYRYRDR
ncbi:hypothetical protein F5Y15DRAFT_420218 [Xylariaceae sp. FL0016]|nr:hypothetical protein F5Y15DRAFT_420218 [Xylariaceae sp. FL0016]